MKGEKDKIRTLGPKLGNRGQKKMQNVDVLTTDAHRGNLLVRSATLYILRNVTIGNEVKECGQGRCHNGGKQVSDDSIV